MGIRAAVFGASGYAGGELVRLIDAHPSMEVSHLAAHSAAGRPLGELHPHLGGSHRQLQSLDADAGSPEIAFLALPHGASGELAADLAASGAIVVDLGADHRFADPALFEATYGSPHPHPGSLTDWVYGLPELVSVAGATRVAVPGCYPTATTLALAPLVGSGAVLSDGVVVDALSGVSGAGRSTKEATAFGAVAESVRAYGVGTHRHRPEMEDAVSRITGIRPAIVFTPHLVPMQRGLLATVYARLADGVGLADLMDVYSDAYGEAPFVSVGTESPQTRWVVGSNKCLIGVFVDEPTGTAVVVSAIDNLVKGAAGQAVQCANLVTGLDEAAGLTSVGWMP
ncbi:MAG: N-acetyl-gamma-glutamyl-phosphate reductase [Acidimicrobiia bacterium]|nr:N-acetyl-gamma-glutamyl-phosphate reductase [Acidimicrobiia bacterium]